MALQSLNLEFSYSAEKHFYFPNINLQAGQSALLLGPSGAGKTTLLHLLAGLMLPLSGEVKIDGTKMFSLTASQRDKFRGQNLAVVFQKSYFLPYLSIRENLLLAAKNPRLSVKATLKQLQVEHILLKKPAQCSIGEQQRASIARAILQQPKVILADEPSSALDDANALKVGAMLKNAAEQHGAALLVVTHDARLKPMFNKTYQL